MTTAAEPFAARRRRPLWLRLLRSGGVPPVVGRFIRRRMPRRLFPRSLMIIVLPMIALQSVVAFVFMDRHWSNVTTRLSDATASEIAATVGLLEQAATAEERDLIVQTARTYFFTDAALLPSGELPPPRPRSLFGILDPTLSASIRDRIERPFWVDTVGQSSFIEVRVKLPDAILQIVARRSQTYASNSHITLVWMVGTSLVLIALAVLVLRNQVRPIQKLADAAERFGRGRPVDDYRPYGALEVRRAAWAFIEMRKRIERQIEQRTAMLAGVSHDLRTILTRFRLEIELLGDGPDLAPMKNDVEAMQAMLEDYLLFARTEMDEHSDNVDIADVFTAVAREVGRCGAVIEVDFVGDAVASVKPVAFRRMLANVVSNAGRFGKRVRLDGHREGHWLIILVDDDGPGIPEHLREEAFRPFHRMEGDGARNQDHEGTGLGLTIARDIARSHGGEIRLGDSPLGGLRVDIRIPA